MENRICAVIVSFNPEAANLQRLAGLLLQCGVTICLVDNNSSNKDQIRSIFAEFKAAQVFYLQENAGIAHAQNVGIQYALDNGNDYVVFFDQDSTIYAPFIQQQITVFEDIRSSHPQLAALGPAFVDKTHGFYYKIVNINRYGCRSKIDTQEMRHPFAASLIISSGTLVAADALRAIGPMDERFFIDYVDTEWCLRARAKGYYIYVNPQVKMWHAIGDNSLKLLKWRVPVHSPFRRYYRIRNAFFLLKLPHVPALLAIREIAFNLVHQLILIVCSKNKMAYVRSLGRGLRDSLNGKY